MYLIRAAEIADVYALARNLRPADRLEVTSLGLEPIPALRSCFRQAIFRQTALVDDEIAAMWGLGGTMLSNHGQPWLLTAPCIEKMPLAFVHEARKVVLHMLRLKTRLEGHVAADYTRAIRLLELLGFSLGDPFVVGPRCALFRTFTMERG